jgi:hypothetical protein
MPFPPQPDASQRELMSPPLAADSPLLLRELGALHRSDGALIVSDAERELLVNRVRADG